jgi:hypothetical protein
MDGSKLESVNFKLFKQDCRVNLTFTSKQFSVYFLTFDNTCCVNVCFILILIHIYVEQSNDTDSNIGLRFSKTSFGWCSLFSFSQFSCEKLKVGSCECACSPARGGAERREVLGHWSLACN